jgi:hypothetical protein
MPKQTAAWSAALVIGVLTLSAIVDAQAASATLQGIVIDESAAVVPAARVAVLNLDTGLLRSTTTEGHGSFVLSLLPPGRYRLTAQHDGFTTTEVLDLVYQLGGPRSTQLAFKIQF